ncbi:MAG: twitch domain-containing radical SAM protein [Oligoflexia bacterium]|nr:twitch domain-containing radical SAM protein [Oligoflexia bacterium]
MSVKNPGQTDIFRERVGFDQAICKWRWSYPVIHVNRGELRTCDKPPNIQITEEDLQRLGTDALLNNPYLIERRKDKLLGLRHPDCFTCIILESRGIQSTRTGKDRFVRYMNDVVGVPDDFSGPIDVEDPRLLRADHPDILEISLSNTCNLKCLYCSPVFSTSWEDEAIQFGEMRPDQAERAAKPAPASFEPVFWLWFDRIKDSLDRIIFIGGEPTINDRFLPFLEKIEDIMRDSRQAREGRKVTINVISNFNAPKHRFDRFLDLLPALSERFILHVEASGEAFGARSEYIRKGLDWNLYTSNIRKLLALRLPNVRFGFQMAVNALCVSSMEELLRLAADLQHEYRVPVDYKENIVVSPDYLAPYILPRETARYLERCHDFVERNLADPSSNPYLFPYNEPSAERWRKYLPFLKSLHHGISQATENPEVLKRFAEFIARNDERRKSDFVSVFPEFEAFYRRARSFRG